MLRRQREKAAENINKRRRAHPMISQVRILLAVSCLFLGTAHAGVLEPAKPSQVVHLRTFGTQCSNGGGIIDLRTYPDGLTEFPYALPPKQVVVVRRVDYQATPGAGTQVFVALEIAGNLVATKAGFGGSNGIFEGSFEFDPGLVVSDISKFCVRTQNGSFVFATATGFLTKNK
jgi:hypothetical protein